MALRRLNKVVLHEVKKTALNWLRDNPLDRVSAARQVNLSLSEFAELEAMFPGEFGEMEDQFIASIESLCARVSLGKELPEENANFRIRTGMAMLAEMRKRRKERDELGRGNRPQSVKSQTSALEAEVDNLLSGHLGGVEEIKQQQEVERAELAKEERTDERASIEILPSATDGGSDEADGAGSAGEVSSGDGARGGSEPCVSDSDMSRSESDSVERGAAWGSEIG